MCEQARSQAKGVVAMGSTSSFVRSAFADYALQFLDRDFIGTDFFCFITAITRLNQSQ